MQCKFLFAFFFMGAFLIQTSSALPSIIDEGVQTSIIDIEKINAMKLIQNTIDFIQMQMNETLKTFIELKFKVTKQADEAIQAVREDLEEVVGKAKKAIEEIQKKAKEAGIDISNCFTDNENKFPDLLEQFLAAAVQCVTNEVDVMRIISSTVNMMTYAMNTFRKFLNDLINCLSDSRQCVIDVIRNVIQKQKGTTIQMTMKMQEITNAVIGLQSRLQICAVAQVASAGIAATGNVDEISKCAADKGLKEINL